MHTSTVLIALIAVGALWLLGAYNRLMRLRQAVRHAFDAVQEAVRRELAQVLSLAEDPVLTAQHLAQDWLHLGAAVQQVQMQSRHAVAHLFEPNSMSDLSQAHDGLATLCQGLEDAAVPAAAPVLALWAQQRQQLLMLVAHACTHYNRAVADYNQACAQWPARAVTKTSAFAPAHRLDFKVVASSLQLLNATVDSLPVVDDKAAQPVTPSA